MKKLILLTILSTTLFSCTKKDDYRCQSTIYVGYKSILYDDKEYKGVTRRFIKNTIKNYNRQSGDTTYKMECINYYN